MMRHYTTTVSLGFYPFCLAIVARATIASGEPVHPPSGCYAHMEPASSPPTECCDGIDASDFDFQCGFNVCGATLSSSGMNDVWDTNFVYSTQGVDSESIDIQRTWCFAVRQQCIGGNCVGQPIPFVVNYCEDFVHIFNLWDPDLGYCSPLVVD